MYRGKGYSPDEVLKIAVADQEVFSFEQSPPSGPVSHQYSYFVICLSVIWCQALRL